jgi:hypothetical protein
VQIQTVYQGSFFAKAADPFIGPIAVKPIDNDTARVLASTTVPTLSSDWKQYSFTLRSGAHIPSANNRLVPSAEKPGKLWFSLVLLFPLGGKIECGNWTLCRGGATARRLPGSARLSSAHPQHQLGSTVQMHIPTPRNNHRSPGCAFGLRAQLQPVDPEDAMTAGSQPARR